MIDTRANKLVKRKKSIELTSTYLNRTLSRPKESPGTVGVSTCNAVLEMVNRKTHLRETFSC